MTEDTFKDLCLCGETTKVQFKEAFTSQREIAKEMIAFANTKGGVILFGVEDKAASPWACRTNRYKSSVANWAMQPMSKYAPRSTSRPK